VIDSNTRKDRQHDAVREEIKQVARRQMAVQGASNLSLRAIAREMEVTAPALYRYFPTRDDLITALIVDAFNAHAAAMDEAQAEYPREAYAHRLQAAMLAYRRWALENRADFELIYGSPIPGYSAPSEITTPAAAQAMAVILDILTGAARHGRLKPEAQIPDAIRLYWEANPDMRMNAPLDLFHLGVTGWSRIHGVLMLEIFEHLPPVVGDTDAFYRQEINTLLASGQLHLEDDPNTS
jgi:AcrR family transcriptional regulator